MTLTARDLLDRLVGFPTISRDSNLDLIDFVEDYLKDYGVDSVRVPNADGTKAALYAHVGAQVDGGVVLSGHTDVVPVDGQDWDTDPFVVTERDGKLFGRGTCDMKGFDALALSAVPLALARGIKRPLQIALSYDEEIGCLGAPPMIDHMVSHGLPRADTVLVGEPSMMQVVTAHKGGIGFSVHVQGFEVHSSRIDIGVSAVMQAARLIDWANRVNAERAAAVPSDLAAAFVPPYTSAHVGRINGGTAHNITAADCRFDLSFRTVPGENVDDWRQLFLSEVKRIEAEMQAIQPSCRITVDAYFGLPGLAPEPQGRAEELARRLTGDNGNHVVSYGTEAGQFQERGYSACVVGPGDIAQAHQPNEFISTAQFAAGEAFIARLIDDLAQ
ncbi:acetylornithine deacetylase [Loktanella sp. SALINAS62]|uniref:acetylornithine deacetylase n=1 Tax=Loktanella sp. SALINAS62 TaxID=2706124 RepID=UPI001B8C7E92|nr:acetylornithine deacetylase [Loktanella sp. SALINAS62]MBS1304234.1 acetylornithine deacetylase [Loktanella sp. SALINAS62]